MFRTIATAATAATVVAMGVVHAVTAAPAVQVAPHPHAAHAPAHPAPWTRNPCAAEDGPGPCYWDAGRRGNHHGRSYWITRAGVVHYLDGTTLRLAD